EHVKDVAAAVAWTREHIAEYGGNPERIFLLGHSAGGHLVSLLATDESYLQAEGLKSSVIKGVICGSGVYHIPPGTVEVSLGGTALKALGVAQLWPLRGDNTPLLKLPFAGFPAEIDIYGAPFGDDPKERDKASPLRYVRPGLPPFLILHA